MSEYRVVSVEGTHGNDWIVVRTRDYRVMTCGSVFGCARWVSVWGSTRGRGKRGMELSPKVREVLT